MKRFRPCGVAISLLGLLLLAMASSAMAKIIYVSPTGDDQNNGLSWENAKRTVTGGLQAAEPGDQIWVRYGRYVGHIWLKDGVSLYGGFRGTESSLSERPAFPRPSPDPYETELHPEAGVPSPLVSSPTTATRPFRLDGFTILGGSTIPHGTTGGVRLTASANLLTVANCTITRNWGQGGGGVRCEYSSPTLINCTITNNSAKYNGGGVVCWSSSPTLINCTISGNSANRDGGGVACFDDSSPTLINCTITGNSARGPGGGVYCSGYWFGASPTLTNCTITGNSGGGVYTNSPQTKVRNSIIAFNNGEGISAPRLAEFRHNCVWGNSPVNFSGEIGNPIGTDGNISVDPLLAAEHLLPGSPCINAGDNSVVTVKTDIDGEPRIMGGVVDIGADEFVFVVGEVAHLSVTRSSVPADNQTTSTLTLTYRYPDGAPIVGRTIRFRSSRGAVDTFSSETAVTNALGQASVTVRSGTPGVSTFTCQDETAGIQPPVSAQVTFTPVEREGPVIDSVNTSLSIKGPFLQHIPLENTITVQIADWKGAPGRVEFRLPNGLTRSVQTAGNTASLTLDMGKDLLYDPWGRWNEVLVTAYNAEGVASEQRAVVFFGLATPHSLERSLWLGPPVVIVGERETVFRYRVRWPGTEIVAEAEVWGAGRKAMWGMKVPRIGVDVELRYVPTVYPAGRVVGSGKVNIGGEVVQRYGVPPVTSVVDFWNFGWRASLMALGHIDVAPLRLRRWGITPALGVSVETPNLLPIVLPWMGFTGIPAAVAIAFEVYGRAEIDTSGEIILCDSDQGLTFQPSDVFLTADFQITAGLNRRVERWISARATAGIRGRIWFQFPGRPENLRYFPVGFIHQLQGSLYVRGVLVTFWGAEAVASGEKLWVYPTWSGSYPAHILPRNTWATRWGHPEREYLYNAKPYHELAQSRRVQPMSDGWDVLEQPLILNTMAYASPALTWKDGKAVMLYVWDDPNLPAHQSTEIRALMQQTDGSWRDVPVTQDTALDSQPAVAVDQLGNLVAVWTRMEDVSPEPDPNLRLPKGEIAYSVYDENTATWSAPRKLTSDNVLDFQPQLVRGADGGLYLLWLTSPDNTMPIDFENPSLPHTDIRLALWDGSRFAWDDTPVTRADTLEASLAVSSLGYPMVVWSADADGNPETDDSRLLFTYWDGNGWLSPMPVRADTNPQSSPTLAVANGDLPVLFFVRSDLPHPQHEGYTQEQLVVTTFNGAGWVEPTPVTQADMLNDLQVTVTPDGKVSAMWVTSSEGVADIWTTVFDGALGRYSQPVRLTQDDMTHEQQLCAAWDPEGNPSAVYIKRRLEREERQIQDEQGNWHPIQVTVPKEADLYLLAHRPKPDLTISELWLDPSNAGGGSQVTMKAKVRNLRALGASNVKVRFYDGDPDAGGTAIGTVTVSPSALVGGGEGEASLQWTLPDDGKARTIYARVDPDDAIAEKDETNNTATWVVAQLDLAAVSPYVEQYLPDGRLKVKFGVRNPSAVNADMDVPYRLRLGDAQGQVLLPGIVRVPPRGEEAMVEWAWSPQLSAGRYNLYLEIDPDNQIEESDEGNNTAQSEVVLAADLLVNPALTWLERGTNGQATVRTTIQNNGWAEAQNVLVQVRTAMEGGTVLASGTIERIDRYGTASLSLPISLSQAGSAVWVVVNPDGAIDEVRRDNNMVGLQTAARTYSVSGQVELQDYVGDVTAVPVMVELRQNGNVVRTEEVSLDAQGGYTLHNIAPGTYNLAFKASHWLRRVRPVEVVASDVLGVSVSLLNGDADGDNEVTLFDFGALVAAFGSVPGDANWNANADLDGDQEVTLFDFGVLVRNFGQMGDE